MKDEMIRGVFRIKRGSHFYETIMQRYDMPALVGIFSEPDEYRIIAVYNEPKNPGCMGVGV